MSIRRNEFVLACACMAAVGGAVVDPLGAEPDGAKTAGYCIRNVSVVDVEKGEALAGRTVVIEGERIAKIGGPDPAPAAGMKTIEGKGLFLMPGLFDAHVHYADPDTYGPLCVAHGVTFVRDMAGFTSQILAQRDRLNSGKELGPEMIATGAILDGSPPIWPFSEVCETPEDGRKAVEKLAKSGVDQIKVYSNLKKDVFVAIVAEAHQRGLKAVGHVPEDVRLEDALKAGQDSCEHMTGFGAAIRRLANDAPGAEASGALQAHIEGFKGWRLAGKVEQAKLDELVRIVKQSGITICPTLVVMKGVGRTNDPEAAKDPHMEFVSPAMNAFWQGGKYGEFAKYAGESVAGMQKIVGLLHRAGVPLMVGTDLANPHVFAGYSVHDEMAMFQEAGVPAADTLRAATIVPARFCGVASRLGSVTVGKSASLVLARANPLEDIRNTQKIAGVFLKGRYFDRAGLDRLLADAKSHAGKDPPKTEAVRLEAPGRIIAKGKYKATFQGMDSGEEDFVISEAADGYHIMAHNRPQGGWSRPSVTTLHVRKDFGLVRAEWREQGEPPLVAHYRFEDGKYHARATRGGETLDPQVLKAPDNATISGPAYAVDFVTVGEANLKVGESKEFNSVNFGFQSWKLQVTKLTVARKKDRVLKRPGGTEASARYYTTKLDIPEMPAFTGELWTDERGVLLKSTLTMPFGKVGVMLE